MAAVDPASLLSAWGLGTPEALALQTAGRGRAVLLTSGQTVQTQLRSRPSTKSRLPVDVEQPHAGLEAAREDNGPVRSMCLKR